MGKRRRFDIRVEFAGQFGDHIAIGFVDEVRALSRTGQLDRLVLGLDDEHGGALMPDLDGMLDDDSAEDRLDLAVVAELDRHFVARLELVVIAQREIAVGSGTIEQDYLGGSHLVERLVDGDLGYPDLVAQRLAVDEYRLAYDIPRVVRSWWQAG